MTLTNVASVAGDGLKSAREISRIVAQEMDSHRDVHFAVRTITNEIHRWFASRASLDRVKELVSQEPDSGDERFDALIEGIVAVMFRAKKLTVPRWTTRTKLASHWAPWGDIVRDDEWYAQSVLFTPVELLDKGIVFDRKNLVRL